MKENIIDTKKLDGKRLYYSFLAGAQKIFDHQALLNKINVFPVHDADTGTNLASTMRSIIDTFIPTDNLTVTAEAIADAALVGARGNSGIIFAQFLYGFSSELKNEQDINVGRFSDALKRAVEYSYEAISNPVEGTMISVMREWAEDIHRLKDKIEDFNQLIVESYKKAKEALLDTPKKLEVLAKANVVDAGGKGFVYFLEGMIDFFKHGELRKILTARNIVKVKEIEDIHNFEEITFRYCSEAMLVGENINKEKIRMKIEHLGDSTIVAGSQRKVRIHQHTDTPDELFTRLSKFGSITFQKVDDMVMQHEIITKRRHSIALVTDSTCDLPHELVEKHQIHVIPLSVHFGDTYYLDGVTLSAERFYKLLDGWIKMYPSTAQPSFKDFSNKYNYLSTHYDSIIGMHISEAMSGTCSNSRKAAKTIRNLSGKNINVLNTKRVSSGLGLVVLRVAEALEEGTGYEELLNKIEDWSLKVKMLVTTKTMKYLIKSGRVSPVKGFIGKLLNVKPIIIVNNEGKTELSGRPFTEKSSMKMALRMAEKIVSKDKLWGYAISHANNLKTAEWFVFQIEKLTGMKPRFISQASPALGTNTGPGVVALSLMLD